MHEWSWNIVLKLDDGESQRRDGQDLRAMNRPIPFELSCWCHTELMGEMSPFVMVLQKNICGFQSGIKLKHLKVKGSEAATQINHPKSDTHRPTLVHKHLQTDILVLAIMVKTIHMCKLNA